MHNTDNLENGLFSPNGAFPTGDQLLFHSEHELVGRILQWGGVGVWTWNATTGELRFTHGFMKRCGYDEEELLPLTLEKWKELLHPEDVAIVFSAFQATVDGLERDYKVRQRVRTKSGQYVTFYTLGRVAERDAEGKTLLVGGFVQDVTQLVEAETDIQRRDRIIAAANESARLLLYTSVPNFDVTVWRVLHLLGTAANTDWVYVWKNYTGSDGRPHAKELYEWSDGAAYQYADKRTRAFAYDKTFPTWYETLSANQCINCIVRLMPPLEQENLSAQGIVSILIAPIQHNGKPWGFIGFDDYRQERTWTDAEMGVLKAIGVVIATAINRQEVEASLETERNMLNQIFDTSPVGLAITTNGVVQRCNRRITELLDIYVGQQCHSFYESPTDRNDILEDVCRKGAVIDRAVRFRAKSGEMLDFLATYQPILYEGKPSILCWMVNVPKPTEPQS